MSTYWLAQWLDENEITRDWELENVLNSKSGIHGFQEAVHKASQDERVNGKQYPDAEDCRDSIVAGRKLDFSGMASCPAYECMRRGVDSTFRRAWHYFDRIVVEGISPVWLEQELKNADEDSFPLTFMKITGQAQLLLYLRHIGADRYIVFAPKSHSFCQEHWQSHARDLGLAAAVNESQHGSTIKKIVQSSHFSFAKAPQGSSWHVTATGKYFDEPERILILGESADEPPTPEAVAGALVSNIATAMISDVSLARRLSLPLVEPSSVPWVSSPGRDKKNAADSTALRIGLPVFDHLTTEDFLKLREDERPEFELYRAGLQRAIQDQLDKDPSRSPVQVAKIVEDEYLRPELAKIEKHARSRRAVMIKKTAVNLTIGTTAAAIGAMTSMPLLVESLTAFGSAVPLVPIMHKFIDDGDTIKMSELYFLWKAEKQAEHR
jgi:hypothetical protein